MKILLILLIQLAFLLSGFAQMMNPVEMNEDSETGYNPYTYANIYRGILTVPQDLKKGVFVYRLANITDDKQLIGKKSIIYPLLDFEAIMPNKNPREDLDKGKVKSITFTYTCKENKLGQYWECPHHISTQIVGSEETEGYNNRQRLRYMRHHNWLKKNPVLLPPDTYIGNMISADKVVVIPPLIKKLEKKASQKWALICVSYSFAPGERGDSICFNMFPVGTDNYFCLNYSNRIDVTLPELKKMLKVNIDNVVKKNNKSEYIARAELAPGINRLFVDITALVPMKIYDKEHPNYTIFPDRSKRISFKTLDPSEWKWTVKGGSKVIGEFTGPKDIKIKDSNSAPWVLRHHLIGRSFDFYNSEIYKIAEAYFLKNNKKGECTVSVSLPLYQPESYEAPKRIPERNKDGKLVINYIHSKLTPEKYGKPKQITLLKTQPLKITYQDLLAVKTAFECEEKKKENLPPEEHIKEIRKKRTKERMKKLKEIETDIKRRVSDKIKSDTK